MDAEELKRERLAFLERQRRKGVVHRVDVLPDLAPGVDALTAQRCEEVEPFLHAVRSEVFGGTQAPFRTVDDDGAKEVELGALHDHIEGRPNKILDAHEAITRATGFKDLDVWEWMLCGTRPRLQPVTGKVLQFKEVLPDGTTIRRREAHLVFREPLEDKYMRRIGRQIRRAWSPDPEPESGSRLREFSDLHRHIVAIVDQSPDASWEERRSIWERTPAKGWPAGQWRKDQGQRSAEALRKFYSRALKLRAQAGA